MEKSDQLDQPPSYDESKMSNQLDTSKSDNELNYSPNSFALLSQLSSVQILAPTIKNNDFNRKLQFAANSDDIIMEANVKHLLASHVYETKLTDKSNNLIASYRRPI